MARMHQQTEVYWPACEQEGCIGIQLAGARMCLAHCGEEEKTTALKQVSESGEIDARGVILQDTLLAQILGAVRRAPDGELLIKSCRFDRATFAGTAVFSEATFGGDAQFNEATFSRGARFSKATFSAVAWFNGAIFNGDAEFGGATFNGHARFDNAAFNGDTEFGKAIFNAYGQFIWAVFNGDADFDEAAFSSHALFGRAVFSRSAWFKVTFSGDAEFGGAAFGGDAWFGGATFSGDAEFSGATFHRAWFDRAAFSRDANFAGVGFGDANFDKATFSGDAEFDGAAFGGDARFRGARFEQTRQFGSILAGQFLMLDEVQFMQQVRIEASSPWVYCRRGRFPSGVYFRLRGASLVLDDTDLGAPSIVTGIPPFSSEELARLKEQIAGTWQQEMAGKISRPPQLLSLQGANLAALGLGTVSVADCRFAGAHFLDKLRLGPGATLATAPNPLGLGGRWWSGRQVIAEERTWRARRTHPGKWAGPGWPDPGWPDCLEDQEPGALEPGQIAELYRALRKGREDVRDEPGAADFYYGEMEMRRHARPLRSSDPGSQSAVAARGRVERGILTAYWLVSGYGLRANRAVAWLAAVTALLALGFWLFGFAIPPHPDTYWTGLLYSFRATLSLTDSDIKLTAWGQLLQGVLRLTGPVLLGLALLALRGRVKR